MADSIASVIIAECVKRGIMNNQEAYVFLNAVHFMYSEHHDKGNSAVKEHIGEWGIKGLDSLMNTVKVKA